MAEQINCTIKKMFQNCPKPDGWFGCWASIRGRSDIKLTGKYTADKLEEGMTLQCEVIEKSENEYVATSITLMTKSRRGIISYLSSKNFPNIGRVTAINIFNKFGEDSIKKIENDPDEVKKQCNLTDDQIKTLVKGVNNHSIENTLRKWMPILTPKQIKEIKASKYSLQDIEKNPYCLLKIDGISFSTADNIALNYSKIARNDIYRISAGVVYTLENLIKQSGDTYINLTDNSEINLYASRCSKTLGISISLNDLYNILTTMSPSWDIVLTQEFNALSGIDEYHLYPAELYYAEENTSKLIADKIHNKNNVISDKILATTENTLNKLIKQFETYINAGSKIKKTYSDEQKAAIKNILCEPISCLIGGPGCGKTEVLSAIKYMFLNLNNKRGGPKIIFLAPTGKAVNKIRNTLDNDCEAETVASFLIQDKARRLPKKSMIIVDESSMLNLKETEKLLRETKNHQICFVGDDNQLPSIEPGKFLSDISTAIQQLKVNGKLKPLTSNRKDRTIINKLTHCFRTKNPEIQENSEKILTGDTKLKWTPDFMLYPQKEDNIYYADTVVNMYVGLLDTNDINEVAILTPTKKGFSGASMLNIKIQESINPKTDYAPMIKDLTNQNLYGRMFNDTKGYEIDNTYYPYDKQTYTRLHVKDRVIQTKNHYDVKWYKFPHDDINLKPTDTGVGIFNGDQGTIARYYVADDADDEEYNEENDGQIVFVTDDHKVYFLPVTIYGSELELGYATTIHKAQGSEYNTVIYSSQSILLYIPTGFASRNLLYTAITRAKENITIVGNKESLDLCINTKQKDRHSMLQQKLVDKITNP